MVKNVWLYRWKPHDLLPSRLPPSNGREHRRGLLQTAGRLNGRGMLMGCTWDFMGIQSGITWMINGHYADIIDLNAILRGFHGMFMGSQWNFAGIFEGYPRKKRTMVCLA